MQCQAVFQSNDPQEPAKFLDIQPMPDSAIFSLDFASSWIAYSLNAPLKFDVRPLVQYIVLEVVRHRHKLHTGYLTTPIRCRQLTGFRLLEKSALAIRRSEVVRGGQAEMKRPPKRALERGNCGLSPVIRRNGSATPALPELRVAPSNKKARRSGL